MSDTHLGELRLFLESLCCDLCRFAELDAAGGGPDAATIHREVFLAPGAFADIKVTPRGAPPYFVEVDYGYAVPRLLESMRRKYARPVPASDGAAKVVLVVDVASHPDWPAVEAELRAALRPGLGLEVWDEAQLATRLREHFGVAPASFGEHDLLELGAAVDRAKAAHAFREATGDPLQASLLWHFGTWRLRQLREGGRRDPRDILPPGLYRGTIIIMADLSSYSSYVRDTRDNAVIRQSLTGFSSKMRDQIVNDGGMLYEFLGDAVIAFFGLPEPGADDPARALACACALSDIGASVANEWQRQIDHIQTAAGVHIAITTGDVQMISFRPFSRTHMGAVADSMNLAERLNMVAGAGEIVASNAFYQRLAPEVQASFRELEPMDARNIGRVRAWKRAAR